MKKSIYALFLIFLLCDTGLCRQDMDRKFGEYSLRNGIRVILHEDFRTPVVIVGIVFPVGLLDVPAHKSGVGEIISKNLVNRKLQEQLCDLGVSYGVTVGNEYTELIATMNPKKINKFLNLVSDNISDISVEDLDVLKKTMIVNGKISGYLFSDVVSNCIFSNIDIKGKSPRSAIFNEKAINSVTESDVKSFFSQHYKNSKITVIVSGAIGCKNLMKALQSSLSKLPKCQESDSNVCMQAGGILAKNISIDSKHVGNSVRYFYRVPKIGNTKSAEVFFEVFSREASKFFKGIYPLISSYTEWKLIHGGDSLYCILLYPKKDISLSFLKKSYEVFMERMTKKKFSPEYLAELSDEKRKAHQFLFADLQAVYSEIFYRHIGEKNVNDIHAIADDLKNADPITINSFAKEILLPNLLLEITTRYRTHE